MRIRTLIRREFTVCTLVALLGGCGGSVPLPGSVPAFGALDAHRQALVQPALPEVAGTYDGSYSETIGSTTVKGSLVADVQQSGSKITGKFIVTIRQKYNFIFPIKGTVASGKHGALLRFTLINTGGKGRNGKCKATVIGSKLKGHGIVPPASGKAAVYLKFSGKKK